MTKQKLIPLGFSSHFLDFSYPGSFNPETRFFITIPIIGQELKKNSSFDYIQLGIEFNSAIKINTINDESFIGIKTFLSLNSKNINNNKLEPQFLTLLKNHKPTHCDAHFFQNECSLYLTIKEKANDFLTTTYSTNWNQFCEEKHKRYKKNTPFIYLNKDDLENGKSRLNYILEKTPKVLEQIFSISNISNNSDLEKLMKNINLTINTNSSSRSITNKILSLNHSSQQPLEYQHLQNLIATFKYYQLDSQLNNQNNNNNNRFKL